MSTEKQVARSQDEKQRAQKRRLEAATEQLGEQVAFDEPFDGPLAAAGDIPVQDVAARLGDTRFQTAQRQAMAARIRRASGNQSLRRALAQVAVSERTQPSETVQRVVDPISAAGLGIAVFGLAASLAPYGSKGLSWTRNIGKAIHKWPAGKEPKPKDMVKDHTADLLWVSCISGLSSAWGFWDLRWNYNGADIDQAHVFKYSSSSWSGGSTGSELRLTFEMQDASASYEKGGKAAMMCYISGFLDPTGAGDIDFEGRMLIFADGTTKKVGNLKITRGDKSDFTIGSYGAGWKIKKE